ncbi:MAG: agmatine deiminase family protein [Phycisphaerales bacterium]|jgi:agmatine deiminase|nr:agmatine deiminase family protein [Phycisphaerales bacterium]
MRSSAALLALALSPLALAQSAGQLSQPPVSQPFIRDGQLIYPDNNSIPRSLTPVERFWLATNPLGGNNTRGNPTPPSGPVHCAAEYEPMQAILVAWNGSSGQLAILAAMGANITTIGSADLYVVGTTSQQSAASTALTNAGANMTRVKYFTYTTNTIWIRDYGPRYIYQGDCRAIVDHTYNRPRAADDAFPQWFGPQKKQPVYDIPLIHGGGNYHLSALGDSYATLLISNENPTLTNPQIISHWANFQNVNTTITAAFPTSVDSTQHIDMWMQILGDRKVMISDWPNNAGSAQDIVCDNTAAAMQAAGYTVHRVPARSISGTHYTYCNTVICNDLLLLPTYTNSTIVNAGHNTDALNAWKTAWETTPQRKVVQVNCQAIVTLAGVMHCIAMHVPAPRGGTNPTAYLKSPNTSAVYNPGDIVPLSWITDDDASVSNVDLQLSLDSGATWPVTIAAATADDGNENWTVPSLYSTHARLRVVARDAQGNTGFDMSDADFTINGPHCAADFNNDGFVNGDDYDAFASAFDNADPGADINSDGFINGDDYDAFASHFEAGC